MATVTITDSYNILINGVNKGHVLDALANDIRTNAGALSADIKAAFDVWIINHLEGVQEATNKAASDVSAANADRIAAIAAKEAAHAAELAKLNADIEALGTKPEAAAIRKAKERESLLAKHAELAAQIAAIDVSLEPTDATSTPESVKP